MVDIKNVDQKIMVMIVPGKWPSPESGASLFDPATLAARAQDGEAIPVSNFHDASPPPLVVSFAMLPRADRQSRTEQNRQRQRRNRAEQAEAIA
jgi:hypothetical protein